VPVIGIQGIGWALIAFGLVIALVGVLMVFGPRIPILGHLPGDIVIQRENVTIYIPLGTMLLISVIASVVIALLNRRP
jgi:Protein of unknown function (DUF2905)